MSMATGDVLVDQGVSPDDALRAAARGLLPLLQENAGHGDDQRRTADGTIDALTAHGMFRLFSPRRFGGFEVTPRTFIEITEILGTADASAAWVVGAAATCAWFIAHGSAELQEEIFGTTPDLRAAGGGAGSGTAVPDGDGYRVTGKWAWASGAAHRRRGHLLQRHARR
jgi:3-hydroxy-9,10-secoandrosta-1,3,5(10)-triene-9,17-dione monooxygenase